MMKNVLALAARGIALALTLSALSAPVAAQPQDVGTSLRPNYPNPTLWGNNLGEISQEVNVTSINYKFSLESSYRVKISAKLYDNNFAGTFRNPREIGIDIPGFFPDNDAPINATRLGFVDFSITGILRAGETIITVRNVVSPRYRWGVKDMRVSLLENLEPSADAQLLQGPVIPSDGLNIPSITPSADILSVKNVCTQRMKNQTSLPIAGYPYSVLEYGNALWEEAYGRIDSDDRQKFYDYMHYSDRNISGALLRQNIGVTDNSRFDIALLQLPGGTTEKDDDLTFWCPAECPTGYAQIAMQCNVTRFNTLSIRQREVLPGYSSLNVCAYDFEGYDSYDEIPSLLRLHISTNVTCARNAESIFYEGVQGSADWPNKF